MDRDAIRTPISLGSASLARSCSRIYRTSARRNRALAKSPSAASSRPVPRLESRPSAQWPVDPRATPRPRTRTLPRLNSADRLAGIVARARDLHFLVGAAHSDRARVFIVIYLAYDDSCALGPVARMSAAPVRDRCGHTRRVNVIVDNSVRMEKK